MDLRVILGLILVLVAAALLVVVFLMLRGQQKPVEDFAGPYTQRRDGTQRDPDSDSIPAYGLILAGFDDEFSTPIRIEMSVEHLADRKYGFSIGRHPDLVDWTIDHPTVSRRHVRFIYKAGRFHLEDLNSTHGTWIREEKAEPYRKVHVRPGDELRLGDLKLDVSRGA